MSHVKGNGAGARIAARLRARAHRTPTARIIVGTGKPEVRIVVVERDPRIPRAGWGNK